MMVAVLKLVGTTAWARDKLKMSMTILEHRTGWFEVFDGLGVPGVEELSDPLFGCAFSLGQSPPQVGPGCAVSLPRLQTRRLRVWLSAGGKPLCSSRVSDWLSVHPGFLIGESFHLFLCCHSVHTHVDVIQDRDGI